MAKRIKRSIIWKIDSETFKQIVFSSQTFSEILRKIGLKCDAGGNQKTLKKRIIEENINIEHLNKKQHYNNLKQKRPLLEILVENSSFSRNNLKKRLICEGILSEICAECNLGTNWNNKPIALQLDHKNGISSDNRLENLRLLCPNCHSQTETYAGKNQHIPAYRFCFCGAKKLKKSKFCKQCRLTKEKNYKIIWPPDQELAKMLWEKPTSQIAKQLGVSDKAIEKRAIKKGLSKPTRGYWMKIK